MFDFLEKICYHDWEVLEYGKHYIDFHGEIREVNDYTSDYTSRNELGRKMVCLKCGTCVDEITPLERKYLLKKKEKEKKAQSRKELAQKIWDERMKGK